MEQPDEINLLKETILKLENELQETKEHLKKYTAPARNKTYYDNNKGLIKSREYKQTVVSSEKKKQYARQAYLNKKEKIKKLKENNENI
tara:strand:- start:586 stop:852 length:267 start_codon:yes stop_codon:yes gene_type:complete